MLGVKSVEPPSDGCGRTRVKKADLLVDGQANRVRLLDVEITDTSHEAAHVMEAFRRWWVPNE